MVSVVNKTYEAIYKDLQALGEKTRPRDKGTPFERVALFFLRNDPLWSTTLGLDKNPENAQLWVDAPPSWRWQSKDLGTDILVEDRDGGIWAIQAKGYRDDRDITKTDLNTFLSDSSRRKVVARVLISSGAALNRNAHDTVNGQEKPVYLVLAEHLQSARITWPSSLKALLSAQTKSAKSHERKTPRKHQSAAIAAVTEGFTKMKVSRGQLLMACGSGKTFVGQQVAEELNAKTVLLLFPSLMLLGQTLNDWAVDASDGKGFDWLAVCSDETVSAKTDEATQHVQDLGIPNVTTNPEHIHSFLTRKRRAGVPLKVIFSTYQSTDRIAEAIKGLDPFDLIICDEAHRMASINRGIKNSNTFTLALSDEQIPARRRLFMTATPRLYGARAKARVKSHSESNPDSETILYSMDDVEVFGKVLHEYSFRDAMQDGVLADYHVVGIVVTESEIQSFIEHRRNLSLRDGKNTLVKIEDASHAAAQVAVAKAMTHPEYNINSLITFHNTLKSASTYAQDHNFYRTFLGLDAITTETVKGSDSSKSRMDTLLVLSPGKPPALVSNARCLTEGIDVPALGGVAFIDPRYSVIDIAQAIGRAIRKPTTNKKIGYIIVPIYIPENVMETLGDKIRTADQELNEILTNDLNTAFTPLVEVLQGLRSFDGMLTETLNNYRIEKGRRKPVNPDARLIGVTNGLGVTSVAHLPITIDLRGISQVGNTSEDIYDLPAASFNLSRFTDAITVACINELLERCSDTWWENYGGLETFIADHGRSPQRRSDIRDISPEEKRLGAWIEKQKQRKESMSRGRQEALEELRDWSWDEFDELWWENYGGVETFIADHGRSPQRKSGIRDISPEEKRLGAWIEKQKGIQNLLPERLKAIKKLLPDWKWDENEEEWQKTYKEVLFFTKRWKHLPTIFGETYDERRLGNWLIAQRQKSKTKQLRTRLATEKLNVLTVLPLWEDFSDEQERWWLFEEYCGFIKREGRLPLRSRTGDAEDEEEQRLGAFADKQRQRKAAGSLTSDKIKQLNDIGFEWSPLETAWQNNFSELKKHLTAHNDTYPTERENKRLNTWCQKQRARERKGTLEPGRFTQLSLLPGWDWNPRQISRAHSAKK